MVYLGTDHRGFMLKEKIKSWLTERGILFEDLGAATVDPDDDYSDYGAKVGEAVSVNPDQNHGIAICGSGAGICVVANKFRGVRAALAHTQSMARAMRNDDDINVLCLAADFLSEENVLRIVETFLNTPFSREERHIRRIEKIEELENE